MTAKLISKTVAGRYHGKGRTHAYTAVKVAPLGERAYWLLQIHATTTVAGLQVSDRLVKEDSHESLKACRAVVARYESLGDGYSSSAHCGRSRYTEAVRLAYEQDL